MTTKQLQAKIQYLEELLEWRVSSEVKPRDVYEGNTIYNLHGEARIIVKMDCCFGRARYALFRRDDGSMVEQAGWLKKEKLLKYMIDSDYRRAAPPTKP
jgi:hypothetical protein